MFQATVLEEMPPFPERESSILAKLKKKKPQAEHKDIEPKSMPANNNAADSVGHIVSPQVDESPPTLSLQVVLHGYVLCFFISYTQQG